MDGVVMDTGTTLTHLLPEIILSVTGLIGLMVAAYAPRQGSRPVDILAIVGLVGAAFALLGAASDGHSIYYGLFAADRFAAFAKLLIYIAAAVAIAMAPPFFARDRAGEPLKAEYAVLILLSAVGMSVMVSATDTMTLYLGLELQSLSAYVLASFMRADIRSSEAGLKYFVLGGLASGILLYGITLLYGFTGTTNFRLTAVALATGVSTGELFGIVLVLCGLAFKISAVPFHMWTPDVYEGAPTPVTAFFASAPKVAAVCLTARVAVEAMGPQLDAWRQIVIFAALASIFLGSIAGIGQWNIKRLLAYSSIANVGFLLIGLAAGTAEGVASMLVYLAIYLPMTMGAFLCVTSLTAPDGGPVERLDGLSGLSVTRPATAFAMAVFMFSLAGIPPLFGFYGKLVVFQAAVAAGLWPVAVAGVVGSVVAAYYYLKIIKLMYFDDPLVMSATDEHVDAVVPRATQADVMVSSVWNTGALWLMVLAVSPLAYLLMGPLNEVSLAAARSLFLLP